MQNAIKSLHPAQSPGDGYCSPSGPEKKFLYGLESQVIPLLPADPMAAVEWGRTPAIKPVQNKGERKTQHSYWFKVVMDSHQTVSGMVPCPWSIDSLIRP